MPASGLSFLFSSPFAFPERGSEQREPGAGSRRVRPRAAGSAGRQVPPAWGQTPEPGGKALGRGPGALRDPLLCPLWGMSEGLLSLRPGGCKTLRGLTPAWGVSVWDSRSRSLRPRVPPQCSEPAWPIPSRQLLYRCFRAWRTSRWRRQAVALALGRRQLLRWTLRTLRWAWWLREAQLEVAASRHLQSLLGRSFRKVRGSPGAPQGL